MREFLKKIFKIFAAVMGIIFLIYLLIPGPRFPVQPHDSVQSLEEADTEIPLKRAYFTNYTRAEALEHYQRQLMSSSLFQIPLPTYRLNYHPEDAFLLVRDQTRSTFLEEIVHPFKESVFVNGFKPKYAKDDIWYMGVHYDQKITVKYIPSSAFIRVPIFIFGLLAFYFIVRGFPQAAKDFYTNWFSDKQSLSSNK